MRVCRGPTRRYGDNVADNLNELVHLEDGQGTEQRRHAEEHRQSVPALRQALADHVHGPPFDFTKGVLAPIHHGKRAGEELRTDAEQRGQPHPEDGAGPASSDGNCNAGDVAEAQRAGQRGAQGFEVRELPRPFTVVVAPRQDPDSVAEIAIGQTAGIGEQKGAGRQ